jgi:2,3-bisphosphoglycerate-independent phosphoglycerate mutase
MSISNLVKETVKAIDSDEYDAFMINLANADMVGHTGDMVATVKACEAVDLAIGKITEYILAKGGSVVITADHGNAEEVVNLQTGERDKEHSNNAVPLIIVANDLKGQAGPAGDPPEGDLSLMAPVGMLADVAPTVLKLLGLEPPPEMTGKSMI